MSLWLTNTLFFIAMIFVAWFFIANFVSVVLHRSIAHHAFKLPNWWKFSIMSICNLCFLYINPRTWVSDHRNHHAHSDTDKDPDKHPDHTYWPWLLHIILHNPSAKDPEIVKMTGDPIFKAPLMVFFSSVPGQLISELSSFLFARLLFGSWLLGAAFWVTVRLLGITVLTIQSYLAHGAHLGFGYRTYAVPDNSSNVTNPIALFLTAGECLQNNHHARPRLATHAHIKSEKDVGFFLVRLLESIGLTKVPERSLPDFSPCSVPLISEVQDTPETQTQHIPDQPIQASEPSTPTPLSTPSTQNDPQRPHPES